MTSKPPDVKLMKRVRVPEKDGPQNDLVTPRRRRFRGTSLKYLTEMAAHATNIGRNATRVPERRIELPYVHDATLAKNQE